MRNNNNINVYVLFVFSILNYIKYDVIWLLSFVCVLYIVYKVFNYSKGIKLK